MISFNIEDVSFVLENKRILKNWIKSSLLKENKKPGDINYIFCSDNYLLEMNQDYLNHDTFTDIITFDYTEPGSSILSGDIYISIERLAENAQKFNVSLSDELYRVMIHGMLHLAGYRDKKKADKEEMTAKEDFYLNLLNKL